MCGWSAEAEWSFACYVLGCSIGGNEGSGNGSISRKTSEVQRYKTTALAVTET